MQINTKKELVYTNLLINLSFLISSVTKHNCTHCATNHSSYMLTAIAVSYRRALGLSSSGLLYFTPTQTKPSPSGC